MPLLKCPTSDALLEYVSIPRELGFAKRMLIRLHTSSCQDCQKKTAFIRSKWSSYFSPEPDITSSLIRVYSRLQNDETLILKGWKLGEYQNERDLRSWLLSSGWIFRGAIGAGLASLLLFLVISQFGTVSNNTPRLAQLNQDVPYARIRFEDKNRVQVHYVQPELIKSVEFETTSLR